MKIRIGRTFEFDAAHKLPDDEIYEKCSNLHGHRYKMEVVIEGPIDKSGWICNFTELKSLINEEIIDKYDHAYLNRFYEIPTVEIMGQHIFTLLQEKIELKFSNIKLARLKLYETSSCFVEIEG